MCREQKGRKDDHVERNVVLSDEMYVSRFPIEPEIFPCVRFPSFLGPFDGGGYIAQDGFKPDIDGLSLCVWEGCRYAPFVVSGERSGLEALLKPAQREVTCVLRQLSIVLNDGQKFLAELWKIEEPVGGRSNGWCRVAKDTGWCHQLERIQPPATGVALVSSRCFIAAAWASSLHEPVRQESFVSGTVGQVDVLRVHVTIFVQFPVK